MYRSLKRPMGRPQKCPPIKPQVDLLLYNEREWKAVLECLGKALKDDEDMSILTILQIIESRMGGGYVQDLFRYFNRHQQHARAIERDSETEFFWNSRLDVFQFLTFVERRYYPKKSVLFRSWLNFYHHMNKRSVGYNDIVSPKTLAKYGLIFSEWSVAAINSNTNQMNVQ
jgi:hypothetical protein